MVKACEQQHENGGEDRDRRKQNGDEHAEKGQECGEYFAHGLDFAP